jgi:hypothetical protein
LPPFPANVVRRVLACQSSLRATEVARPWQSFHLARYRADLLFRQYQAEVSEEAPLRCP